MPKELRKEIEDHLATFPERHNDVIEMQKEWKEWKSRTFWVMATFITSMLGIGVWVGTIEAGIGGLENEVEKSLDHHEEYEKRLNVLEVNNGEIRTRLNSIESTLQEIKLAIIKLQ